MLPAPFFLRARVASYETRRVRVTHRLKEIAVGFFFLFLLRFGRFCTCARLFVRSHFFAFSLFRAAVRGQTILFIY